MRLKNLGQLDVGQKQVFVAGEDAQYAEMSRLLKANPELLEEYVKRNASKKTLEQVTSIVHHPDLVFDHFRPVG